MKIQSVGGAEVASWLRQKRICSHAHSLGCGGLTLFLLLARDVSDLLSGPVHRAAHHTAAGWLPLELVTQERVRVRERSHSLIVTYFWMWCPIRFAVLWSQEGVTGPVHTQKEGLFWSMNAVLGGGHHWGQSQRLPTDAPVLQCV